MLALCVDDERLGLEALKRVVSSAPQVTGTAAFESESEALLWAGYHRPDVAFLDIQMHDMGGLMLAQRLRELHPSLPIIFCTAYENYAVRAMNLHIDASYLLKPVQREAVAYELDRILAKPPEKLHWSWTKNLPAASENPFLWQCYKPPSRSPCSMT